MILTVTLNASIDKRYVVNGFHTGKVNRIKDCSYVPGGKGLNVSKAAAIYGEKVVATGFLGGHAGAYIEEQLSPFGITGAFYHVKNESRSCINIWDLSTHSQTEFLEPGFILTQEDFDSFLKHFSLLLPEADVITISGSVPRGLEKNSYCKLIHLCRIAKKKVILDTSGELLSNSIQAKPFMIKPNIDEMHMLTGNTCHNLCEIIRSAIAIHQTGIEIVAVSLGADGCLLICNEGVFRALVPKIETTNTVGCGDSMTAGFAIGLSHHMNATECLRLASAISAATAAYEVTGLFRMDDLNMLIDQIKIKRLSY